MFQPMQTLAQRLLPGALLGIASALLFARGSGELDGGGISLAVGD